MPAPSQWLPLLPEIIGELKVLTAPVVDRALVEKLFALKRRQAIGLCHRFGGFQAGRTFLSTVFISLPSSSGFTGTRASSMRCIVNSGSRKWSPAHAA